MPASPAWHPQLPETKDAATSYKPRRLPISSEIKSKILNMHQRRSKGVPKAASQPRSLSFHLLLPPSAYFLSSGQGQGQTSYLSRKHPALILCATPNPRPIHLPFFCRRSLSLSLRCELLLGKHSMLPPWRCLRQLLQGEFAISSSVFLWSLRVNIMHLTAKSLFSMLSLVILTHLSKSASFCIILSSSSFSSGSLTCIHIYLLLSVHLRDKWLLLLFCGCRVCTCVCGMYD